MKVRAALNGHLGERVGTRLVFGIVLILTVGACAGAGDEERSVGQAQPSAAEPDTSVVPQISEPPATVEPAVTVETTIDEPNDLAEEQPSTSVLDSDDGEVSEIVCEPAPLTTSSIVPWPPWSSGGARQLELRTRRDDSGQPTIDGAAVTPVLLEFSPVESGGWSFLWQAQPTLLGDLGLSPQVLDAVSQLVAAVPPQRIRYRLDPNRYWLGVDNPDEVRDSILLTLDALGPFLGDSTEQTKAIFAEMSDEALGVVFAEEPALMHVLEGIEFIVGEVVSYPDQLPNAFGGRPFPATTSFEVVDLVDADGCISIQQLTRPDPEQFAEIMAESLADAFGSSDDDAEQESLEIETRVIAQYDFGSGFFRRIQATRRINSGDEERLDTVIIVDVTDDQAAG